MKDIKAYLYFLDKLSQLEIFDADGNRKAFDMQPGLSRAQIREWETSNKKVLSEDFLAFIGRWNGGHLFGLEILPLEETNYIGAESHLSFHNWGNGDLDCIGISSENSGKIFFANHENGQISQVAPSFYIWLSKVIEEKQKHRVLYHPMDYIISKPTYRGLYADVPYT
jgi:hypothetical protein